MPLVSVAKLKEYLPEISGSAADATLEDLIERTEAIISRYLGFPAIEAGFSFNYFLTNKSYTLYLDGPMFTDPNVLQIPIRPIQAITSIHSDPNLVYGASTEITSDEYVLDKQNSRIILLPEKASIGFDTGYRYIKVVLNAGYSQTTDGLQHAICVYASQLHRNKTAQGKESLGQRGSSTKFSPKDMPYEVKQILNTYRSTSMVM